MSLYERDDPRCENCGRAGLWRESVDVGVGIIYGPYGCPFCGWSEDPAYDISKGSKDNEKGYRADQFGGLHPPGCHCLLPGFNGCAMRLPPPEPVSPADGDPGRQDGGQQ